MQSKRNLKKNRRGVSPAVSTVIITAASVVLVLVAANFALQVLQSQRAIAEFDTAKKSILAFDDAVRDIAWDQSGSRSIRFTNSYGNLRLIPNDKTFNINFAGLNNTSNGNLFTFKTASVKYQMPTGYGMPGVASSYILGSESAVVSNLTASMGQALVKHESGFNSITLNYRVRVTDEGAITVSGAPVNYVDIFVIRLNCTGSALAAGDFDLGCRNVGLKTIQLGAYVVTDVPTISVSEDAKIDVVNLGLNTGKVVIFNLIIADVRVSY
jgi:hypothetical protein